MRVNPHFASVDGGTGRVWQQIQTGWRAKVITGHGRQTTLWSQRRTRPGVRRLPQLAFEEILHLAPLLLCYLHITRFHHPYALFSKWLPQGSRKGGVTARHDGWWRLHVPPLPPCDTILELSKRRARFVLHGEVEHTGCHVVAGELDCYLELATFLLLSSCLRVELEPSAEVKETEIQYSTWAGYCYNIWLKVKSELYQQQQKNKTKTTISFWQALRNIT